MYSTLTIRLEASGKAAIPKNMEESVHKYIEQEVCRFYRSICLNLKRFEKEADPLQSLIRSNNVYLVTKHNVTDTETTFSSEFFEPTVSVKRFLEPSGLQFVEGDAEPKEKKVKLENMKCEETFDEKQLEDIFTD